MSWILLTTLAQVINAFVAIVDKYLVTDEKAIPKPFVLSFYTCLITAFWLVIYVFNLIPGTAALGLPQLSSVQLPTLQVIGLSLWGAFTFFLALVSLYDALKRADASDVMPVIGAVSAITTFGLAWWLLGAEYPQHFFWGVLLLALGTFMASQVRFGRYTAFLAINSGIFFALHYIAMKGLFQATGFDNGFFWSRMAFVVFALALLFVPFFYKQITGQTKVTTKSTGILVFGSKILAGIAAFMILKATDLGDVAVVQALDGLKFVFILIIGLIVGRYLPKSVGERASDTKTILRKFLYVSIICIGFMILFI